MPERRPLIAIRRLDLEEESHRLAVDAILAHHPKAKALAALKTDDYDDEGLMEIVWRLHSWLNRQPARG
jgi:hypothetical protein